MSDISIHDADMSVMNIMDIWPETISVFLQYKMLCIGCSIAPFHTIEEACAEHNLDVAAISIGKLDLSTTE